VRLANARRIIPQAAILDNGTILPQRRFPAAVQRVSLISIKLPRRENQLCSWPATVGVHAMQDGFPHSVAVVLGFALACALSLFVVTAWDGFLH